MYCLAGFIVLFLKIHLQYPEPYSTCHGECPIIISHDYIVSDFIFGLIRTISNFYLKIFFVARHQAKVINTVSVLVKSEGKDVSTTSAAKAAKTLGVLVGVYFIYWIPYAIGSVLVDKRLYNSAIYYAVYWLMYTNSCMNPLMYAFLYPWFRISVKHILTPSIFNSSSHLNIFREQ